MAETNLYFSFFLPTRMNPQKVEDLGKNFGGVGEKMR
jgi:hypothetical protein